jgi:hypothetical protein
MRIQLTTNNFHFLKAIRFVFILCVLLAAFFWLLTPNSALNIVAFKDSPSSFVIGLLGSLVLIGQLTVTGHAQYKQFTLLSVWLIAYLVAAKTNFSFWPQVTGWLVLFLVTL